MEVETVSLNDLLMEARAPEEIDFMSVDTEKTEFNILSNFDFDKWRVRCLTIEHNDTSNRQKVFDLMNDRGYRKWPGLGHVDDWFARR